jgi:putative ABC transport system permease protein
VFLRALRLSVARRPKRFAIAVAAVTVGVGMAIALVSVSIALGDKLAHTAREYGANLMVLPAGADTPLEVAGTDLSAMLDPGALPDSSIRVIRGFRWRNSVLGFAPQSFAAVTVLRADPAAESGAAAVLAPAPVRAAAIGTWFARSSVEGASAARPAGMSTIAPWWKVDGRLPAEGDSARPEALVGRALAARVRVSPGSTIRVALDDASHTLDARVSGVLDAGGFEDDQLYLPIETLATLEARPATWDRVLLSVLVVPGETPPMPDPARDLAAYEKWACRPYAGTVARELEQSLPGASVRPVADLVRPEGRVVDRLNLLMILLTGAALAAATLGVMSTMVASVVDRTSEIALLRAIGASHASVGALFLGEMALVAALGGVLGAALGFVLAQVIGEGAFGTPVPPQPLLVPAGLVIALVVCVAGAWFPLRRIASIDPARALRPGA